MVRKLKFHEQKLLKKVDYISWSIDNSQHENGIMRRYHLKSREEYKTYNKLSREVRDLAKKVKDLSANDPFRAQATTRLLDKLYNMGLIPTQQSLELCNNVSASSFCCRRLPVVMYRLKMAETVALASQFVEQGHVRVGPDLVNDPAFLVTRNLEDFVTWTNASKIRKHVNEYNDLRDDFEVD